MLLEVEVAFVVEPGLVLKKFFQCHGLCTDFFGQLFQWLLPDRGHIDVGMKVGIAIFLVYTL